MANLNEDVLRHIFDYLDTPLEWIQVSKVCQLWKRAVEKQWRKITEINYLDVDLRNKAWKTLRENDVPVISANEAKKILHYAAPFVKILIGTGQFDEMEKLVQFGTFLCKVSGINSDAMLNPLVQRASKITEIHFDRPPQEPILAALFDANIIRKVEFTKCKNFYNDTDANFDDIEELIVGFDQNRSVVDFEECFPNLKKLSLSDDVWVPEDLQILLSTTLPFVPGLKSFHLNATSSIHGMHVSDVLANNLLDICKLSELEQLTLEFSTFEVTSFHSFLTELVNSCPRIREFNLLNYSGPYLFDGELRTLLSLPCLENLTIVQAESFQSIQLARISNLTRLKMQCGMRNLNVTCFCDALKMMPKLQDLELDFNLNDPNSIRDLAWRLVCGIAIVTVSQEKNLVIKPMLPDIYDPNLKIAKEEEDSSDHDAIPTLNLKIDFVDIDEAFFERMKIFARNNLPRKWVVTEDWIDE